MQYWEHFDRGADIGVRGFGPKQAAAFEQSALALTAVVVSAVVNATESSRLAHKVARLEPLIGIEG